MQERIRGALVAERRGAHVAGQRAGLVRRVPDPSDGRASLVFLEPRGHELRPVAAEVTSALESQVAAVVGAEDAERLRGLLREVAEL